MVFARDLDDHLARLAKELDTIVASNKVNGKPRPDWLRQRFTMGALDWTIIVLLVVALVAIAVISFATPWLGLDASVFQALIPGGRA